MFPASPMDSVPLQILHLVRQIVGLEESMGASRTDTVAGRYVARKLSKYLAKAYSRVAALYDTRHFTKAQYESDAGRVCSAEHPLRAVPKWVGIDIEKHYRARVDAFLRAHTLDVEEAVRTIRLRYKPAKNAYEKFLCAADVNRYLRFYAELHGIGRRPGRALHRRTRGSRSVGADASGGTIYCMVCRRVIARKMAGYHLGAGAHSRRARHFTGKSPIFDYCKKYRHDIRRNIRRLQRRNEGLLGKINRTNRERRAEACPPPPGPRERSLARKGTGPHDAYTQASRTERQDLDFEEFEDGEGNVYDGRTYEDLVNNQLL